jgi:N,N'-diacetyllegionaminate synthase
MEIIVNGGISIGGYHPVYIIAEAGVNHNGSLNNAIKLVKSAKNIGANCIKFQTFKAEALVTKAAPKAAYQHLTTDASESQYEMLKKLELAEEEYVELVTACKNEGIQFLSTPYDFSDADFLNKLGVDAFKISSAQIVELPFLVHVAGFGKPIILSTGMATFDEVIDAVEVIRNAGNKQIAVLQCTTNYPSKIENANIRAMKTMGKHLQVIVGYSDHTIQPYAVYSAVANGAKIIEKHFTLDKNLPGPDHSSSFDVGEFSEMIAGIRAIESSLGNWQKTPADEELQNIVNMRRSIVPRRNIAPGETITRDLISFKRPAIGLEPKYLDLVLGKKAEKELQLDKPFSLKDLY